MIDHSSSEISTEDAAVLLEAVRKELETDEFKFYVGTSYRHLLIWDKGEVVSLAQPHDILEQKITDKLPENKALYEMMKKSYDILVNHPINIERKNRDFILQIPAGSGEQEQNRVCPLLKKRPVKRVL